MVPPSTDIKLLLTVSETAKALGIGRTMTWALIRDGKLETKLIGRRRLVTVGSVRLLAETGTGAAL